MSLLCEAISASFQLVKLANLSMGFRIPHFHCHVYPQYQHYDPFRLLNPQEGDARLDDESWDKRLRLVRGGFIALSTNES